jgi:hypothetical protein
MKVVVIKKEGMLEENRSLPNIIISPSEMNGENESKKYP